MISFFFRYITLSLKWRLELDLSVIKVSECSVNLYLRESPPGFYPRNQFIGTGSRIIIIIARYSSYHLSSFDPYYI